ncbi:acyltransferase [Paenibacillus soyae]|uniref:Acyltransferase n=1 Tax=Paenibacillus soyae TaxID=2969249 RepID=A0A9X2MPB4_9BACL|nr:acyltransferase [Paenibacillus soyae]MCR2803747.1 acyltransferase [Paenibacillus soyae]
MKKNIVELNVVKAVAILAVLLIHVSADPRVNVPWGSASAPFYMVANQLSMFAVPVFILVNGLVLFYRYHDDWSFPQAVQFYKKRLKFIVMPYVIWSAIYYLYRQVLGHQPVRFDFRDFVDQLWWGETGYHLYFMVIIIQFYLVFPLLMAVVRKLRMKPYHLVLLGVLVQGVFYSIHHYVEPFERSAKLLPNYAIVFGVGAAIGMSYATFAEKFRQVWWTFGLTIFVGFTYLLMLLANQDGTRYWPPAYVILYNLYAVLAGISLIWIGKIVTERSSRIVQWVLALGAASFGIYLVHPAVLSTWKTLFNPAPQHMYYHPYIAVTMLVVIAVPWLIVYLTKKIKFSWLLWGR